MLSGLIVPGCLLATLLAAACRRLPAYDLFVEGAREGIAVAVRVLPNLDEAYMRSDPSLPAFAVLLNEKCSQWEELCRRQQKHWTSLKANTILTASGTYFNPNLTEISFRMLTAPEGVTRAFAAIRRELAEQGIEQLISKVTLNLR